MLCVSKVPHEVEAWQTRLMLKFLSITNWLFTCTLNRLMSAGIWPSARSEPSLGPVLPRVPTHQPSTAAADVIGTAVREPSAAQLP